MSRKPLLALLSALVALALVPAGASAKKVNIAVGIGDQNASMFATPEFRGLKVKKARYFIRWDAIDSPAELDKADAWLSAARSARVRPYFHVDDHFDTKLPSLKAYKSKVRRLVKRYRSRVKEWGSWNEVNSKTQPTFRNPKRVAQYFLAMRSFCKGCTIVALDMLDTGNMKTYTQKFFRALGRRKKAAKIIGIHSYGATNRNRLGGVKLLIKTARRYNKRADFWLTETGGLAYLRNDTQTTFPCNEKRQAKAVTRMFTVARKFRRFVDRLYPYNFYATDCDTSSRFDAGLIRRDGTKRPAYTSFRRGLKNFRR